jgi:hypothetical protein
MLVLLIDMLKYNLFYIQLILHYNRRRATLMDVGGDFFLFGRLVTHIIDLSALLLKNCIISQKLIKKLKHR